MVRDRVIGAAVAFFEAAGRYGLGIAGRYGMAHTQLMLQSANPRTIIIAESEPAYGDVSTLGRVFHANRDKEESADYGEYVLLPEDHTPETPRPRRDGPGLQLSLLRQHM